jgi:hypothetical protein
MHLENIDKKNFFVVTYLASVVLGVPDNSCPNKQETAFTSGTPKNLRTNDECIK